MATAEATVRPNETTAPIMPCASVEETREFFENLGFTAAYAQTRPYPYLIMAWSGFALHWTRLPKGGDPSNEDLGACIVYVDDIAPYHAHLTAKMREAYGKVLATGRPRLTRYRPGASRFTLVDPTGNAIMFIRRDEPLEVEYGGAKELTGLAKALDNARILREFKQDDKAAHRALNSALRKHPDAPAVERATALAAMIELAVAMGEHDRVPALGERLGAIALTAEERARVEAELGNAGDLREWLGE
ncbi:hypothetical protein Afil01_43740 [Actinorhabdospora filicis]|uniref:Glyoxalase n=1 Tax=Actinorhabdospora filicis TaxID=1785913 RepID=A0A9W6W4R8_9ACTN|nr:glyoxalase [Actinorhabdospora filicis]GLZ79567.1 hypothetical protein Afil01_43740 [Actinorhabdospora filicis]